MLFTAIECGVKAHENNSQDYRPFTLLGAIVSTIKASIFFHKEKDI
jgi:hypothetical protein